MSELHCTHPETPTREIRLSGKKAEAAGAVAIVDLHDYDYLIQWKWHLTSGGYACSSPRRGVNLQMHNAIADRSGIRSNLQVGRHTVDHRNGKKLDNRRSNLRIASLSQQSMNTKMHRGNASGCKGVYLHKPSGLWRAMVAANGKRVLNKYFKTKEEAAECVMATRTEIHGEFAKHE